MTPRQRKAFIKQLQNDDEDFYKNKLIDNFGHRLSTTVWNLLTSLVFWLIYFIPFVFTTVAFIIRDRRIMNFTWLFAKFLLAWLIFFIVLVIIETLLTQHRYEYVYHGGITYNPKRLYARKMWLDWYYQQKFGKNLHDANVYYVRADNNIPTDYIIKQYKKMQRIRKDH